jgi:hypothetical protein
VWWNFYKWWISDSDWWSNRFNIHFWMSRNDSDNDDLVARGNLEQHNSGYPNRNS